MRKGILSALAVMLASAGLTHAQETIAVAPAAALLPPEMAQKTDAPKDATLWSQPQAENSERFWMTADYLLWWVKNGPIAAPLATMSNNLADVPPGALNQPGTQVLVGDRAVNYGTFSGMRLGAGVSLGSGVTLEGSYFLLERRSSHFGLSSDANGAPLIGIPFFNTAIGIEDALLTSNPDPATGQWTGTTSIASHTRLQGWEVNLASQIRSCNCVALKGLIGFRTLDLNEDLIIQNQFQPLVGGNLTFLGAGVPAGTILTDFDRIHATNHFYGGQIGGQAKWQSGALSFDVTGKIALGANQQVVNIVGQSTSTPPGGVTATAPGGIFAQTSNIGRYYHSTFAVVPEVGFNVGWSITDHVKARIGYSFLYMSRVARPGQQIDHAVDQTLVPTHQSFGLTPSTGRPAFAFRETDFWAQGINFGLEFIY